LRSIQFYRFRILILRNKKVDINSDVNGLNNAQIFMYKYFFK